MLPKGHLRDQSNLGLKCQARDEAYKRMWIDIYRSKMRYDPFFYQDELGLSDGDVAEINSHYGRMEESEELPIKFVTINLPNYHQGESDRDGSQEAKAALERCLKKVYVGEWHYCFELGKELDHPHYHVIFKSTVKWLAKSRIISEWAEIFKISKNFIHVISTSKAQMPNLKNYISKEQIYQASSSDLIPKKHEKNIFFIE